jgi:flagellin-like protein
MKGVSAIIATILILMITISMTSLGYITFTSFFSTVTNASETALTQTVSNMMAQMKIESIILGAGPPDTAIYIRNIGKVNLTNFTVYDDDAVVPLRAGTPASGSIAPGEVKNINVTSAVASKSVMKVTTGQGTLAIQQAP